MLDILQRMKDADRTQRPSVIALGQLPDPTPEELNADIAEKAAARLREALSQLTDTVALRAVRFDKVRQEVYLAAIAAGVPQHVAAVTVAGVSPSTPQWHARHDPEFKAALEEAWAIRSSKMEERLENIAMDGDPGSMATVRAAETVLKSRAGAFTPKVPGAARVDITRRPDGTQSMSASVGNFMID